MLTAMRLGNFKAFAGTQRLPIKPLTLIFGANSSGKSSLIHGLLLAQQALRSGDFDGRPLAGDGSIDLGGFTEYVHRRDPSGQVYWEAEVDAADLREREWVRDPMAGGVGDLLSAVRRLRVGVTIGMPPVDSADGTVTRPQVGVRSYELWSDERSLLRISHRQDDGRLHFDRLDTAHPMMNKLLRAVVETTTTVVAVHTEDMESARAIVDTLLDDLACEPGALLPGNVTIGTREQTLTELASLQPIGRGTRAGDIAAVVRLFLPRRLGDLLTAVHRVVEEELARVLYLGPLRSYPPRDLIFMQGVGRRSPSPLERDPRGDSVWEVLATDAAIRERVDDWLSSPTRLQTRYKLAVQKLVDFQVLQDPLGRVLAPLDTVTREAREDYEDEGERAADVSEVENEFQGRSDEELLAEHAHVERLLERLTAEFRAQLGFGEEVDDELRRAESEDEARSLVELQRDYEKQRMSLREEMADARTRLLMIERTLRLREERDRVSELRGGVVDAVIEELQKISGVPVQLLLHDLRSNTRVSHRDVGVGVSQILPVLVGAFAAHGRIVAIEQPELHLHPALQAELGDLFISSALGGRENRFILETHSEHLILRIMRRMRDTVNGKRPDGIPPVRPEDVAILYVEPKSESEPASVVRELELDEEGDLLDPWPGGFFEEGFRERFS